jgi:hypothetical protein
MTKKKGYILRDFNDAGTGESYTAGSDPVLIDAGAFANFAAAGLVSASAPEGADESVIATRQAKPRARSKPKAKAAPTAATTPSPAPEADGTQP